MRPPIPTLVGCSDGGCVFGHPGGMHTNGGCRCLKEIRPFAERIRIERNIRALMDEVRKLQGAA